MLKPLFHLSVASLNTFIMWYDQKYLDIPIPYKGMEGLPLRSRSMFLTLWCLVIQTMYHALAFVNDISPKQTKKTSNLQNVLDKFFALAFPLALYVTSVFWSLYFIDKEAIFPDHIERLYPPGFNHVMHTTVALFMVIELFISRRNYPSRKSGMWLLTTFLLFYTVWFFYIYSISGGWVYPFFEHISWTARISFLCFSAVVALSLYVVGEKLNELVWPAHKKIYTNGVNGVNGKSH